MVVGAIVFLAGYMLCYLTQKQVKFKPQEKKRIVSDKVISSFKNPLQPYSKVIKDGLYIPQKPKGVSISER